MASSCVNSDLLTGLKHEAQRLAEQRGHVLSPFSSARHDPLRHVSFCTACGGLVIVDADPSEQINIQRMYGYALQANCARDWQSRAAPAA
jgi:hypothetical protein